jgi:iron complex outermembrane receptor protein
MRQLIGPGDIQPRVSRRCQLTRTSAVMIALVASGAAAGQAWAAAPTSDNTAATVGELVVTAQRKQQNLVDVPVSVAVVGAQALKTSNYTTLTDLQYIAPSVTYNTNFGGGFEIRGVGTQSVTASVEQSVSVVIDDVVYGLPEISFAGPSYQALTDIDRVEILRGPQGTLFGKNSSAGVLQVVTTRPALGVVSGDASASYGTGNEVKLTADVNAPIGQTAAFRISAFDYRRDGFVHNLYTHQDVSGYDNYGVRAKLLWDPTPKSEIYIIGSYVHDYDSGNGIWTLRSCGSGFHGGLGLFSACAEDAKYGVVASPTNLSGAWDGKLGVNQEAWTISGRASYDLGIATLKSITAYQDTTIHEDVEVDSSDLPILSVNHNDFYDKEFTQEFRLDGKYGPLDFTSGLFYYHTDVNYPGLQAGTYNYLPPDSPILLTSGVGGPTPCCISVDHTWTTSWAAFGQATYHVTHALLITGGLRYTHDTNKLDNFALDSPNICQFAYAFGGPCKPAVGLPSPVLSKSISASNVSGKVTVQYYFTPTFNVYATYATGYKGPSISYPRGLPLLGVNPETSTDYEAGFKGTFLDGRLYLAADGFYTTYKNFQGQALYIDPSNPGNRSYVTTNAGGLRTDGAEAEATFRPTPELTLNAAFAYQHTEFTQFAIPCNDGFTNPATIPGQCTFMNPAFPGTLQFNAAGYPLPYAPEYIFSLSFNWVHPISGDYEVEFSGNYHWQSENYTVVADPNTIVPAYGILGMNVSFGPRNEHWKVNVFARNLLDQYFVTGIFKTPLDTGTAHSNPLSTIGYSNIPSIESGRTIGVKAEVKF